MLNKNHKFIIITFLIINYFLAIKNASASQNQRFYGGVDLSFQQIHASSEGVHLDDGSYFKPNISDYYKTSSIIPSIFAGIEINNKFKIEASYIQTDEDKANNNTGLEVGGVYPIKTNFKLKTQTISLDFKPYINLNENLNGYLIVGLSHNKINIEEKYDYVVQKETFDHSISKIAPVAGFGLEYLANKNIFLRGQFKYIHTNNNVKDSPVKKIDNITQINLGLGYYF